MVQVIIELRYLSDITIIRKDLLSPESPLLRAA